MKYFPPKDTLHLLLPPANHALSCTRCIMSLLDEGILVQC